MPSSRTRSSVCSSVLPPRDASNPPPAAVERDDHRFANARSVDRPRTRGRGTATAPASPPRARADGLDAEAPSGAPFETSPSVDRKAVDRSIGRSVDRAPTRGTHRAHPTGLHHRSKEIDRPVITPTREVSHRSCVDVHVNRSYVVLRSNRGRFDRKEVVSIERRWYRPKRRGIDRKEVLSIERT